MNLNGNLKKVSDQKRGGVNSEKNKNMSKADRRKLKKNMNNFFLLSGEKGPFLI